MIYNSTVKSVNESEIDTLLENAEDRFEYETMLEATAIVLGEQEENWTRFMKGVGLSELRSVMEGEEVIYEGARFDAFVKKAKEYFELAKSKLAELTKRFIAKVMQLVPVNNAFVKKYGDEIKKVSVPADFEFKGYKFNNSVLDATPSYKTPAGVNEVHEKDAEDEFTGVESGDALFGTRVRKYLYGSEEKVTLKGGDIKPAELVDAMKNTKDLKKKATDSYSKAKKEIDKIIKELEKAKKENLKAVGDDKKDVTSGNAEHSRLTDAISYWKKYASCAMQYHGSLTSALGARNRQAKAIATKLLSESYKKAGKAERAKIRGEKVNEGYITTDAFLGAVEFI